MLLTRDAVLGDGVARLRPKVMSYLLGLDRRPDAEEPRQIMQYTVLGPLDVQGNARVFGASNPAGESVLLYCVPTVNASDQAQAELLATREHDALAELAVEDRTWRVQGWFDWEGYRVTPIIPAIDGTNLRKLAATAQPQHGSDHRVPPDVAAAIVHDAFVALASVHAKHIVHRALQLRSIEVTPADRVRFCDFSRSRIPSVGTIASTLDDDHPSAAFHPPGCTLEFFQPKDDVYSLALCLVQWIHGDAHDHPDHILARNRAATYPVVGPILARCLASDHDERPDAAEVAAATAHRQAVPIPANVMAPGALLDGRFRLLRELGAGAWAVTWLGFDENVEKHRTLKHMRPHRVSYAQAKAEFANADLLRSRYCARVYDLLSHPEPGVLVQEYICGQTLQALVHGRSLEPEQFRRIAVRRTAWSGRRPPAAPLPP